MSESAESARYTVGVVSNLTPLVSVPHRRELCGYDDCAEQCAPTREQRAQRPPAVAEWMRSQVAGLGSGVVGFVACVEGVGIERGRRRPITNRLLLSTGTEWEEWRACSVVDLIADGGTLVVLTDSDETGAGERAAIELARSRGLAVDVRRYPC